MKSKKENVNQITLLGVVSRPVEFSHETKWEKFYKFYLSVKRKSGYEDVITCIVPEVYSGDICIGKEIRVVGNIRTRNEPNADNPSRNRLVVEVFVNMVEAEEVNINYSYNNFVSLRGYVCTENKCRETPSGRRICDVVLAVHRFNSGKTDYIPCIAWGRDAERIALCEKGMMIYCNGRLQSRTYVKHFDDGSEVEKVAYELSISGFEEVGFNED